MSVDGEKVVGPTARGASGTKELVDGGFRRKAMEMQRQAVNHPERPEPRLWRQSFISDALGVSWQK